jgi:two-component system, OmpR family, response regulator
MSRILVIDDEPNICQMLARILTRAGHHVGTASDGLSGVALARNSQWDLVILDLLLPDIPGSAVLSAILAGSPEQRVMILSCAGDTDTRVECLERGAVDFITKPFSTRELMARVRSRLDLPHLATTEGLIESGALRLDLVHRTLEIEGVSYRLSPRESVLVQHLMRQLGTVCTREELLQQVWDYAFEPDDDVVDLTVQGLRSKLPRELIKSVGTTGYALEAM